MRHQAVGRADVAAGALVVGFVAAALITPSREN
jgi:hypothetical protein